MLDRFDKSSVSRQFWANRPGGSHPFVPSPSDTDFQPDGNKDLDVQNNAMRARFVCLTDSHNHIRWRFGQ